MEEQGKSKGRAREEQAAGEPPLGADGYGRQQAGVQGGQPIRLVSLRPCLLTAMGGRGDSREGSQTSCKQPIAGSQLGIAEPLQGADA